MPKVYLFMYSKFLTNSEHVTFDLLHSQSINDTSRECRFCVFQIGKLNQRALFLCVNSLDFEDGKVLLNT